MHSVYAWIIRILKFAFAAAVLGAIVYGFVTSA